MTDRLHMSVTEHFAKEFVLELMLILILKLGISMIGSEMKISLVCDLLCYYL